MQDTTRWLGGPPTTEQAVTAMLDRAEVETRRLPDLSGNVAREAIKALRKRTPELARLGTDGVKALVARAGATSADPLLETAQDILDGSRQDARDVMAARDRDLAAWRLVGEVAQEVAETGWRVLLTVLVGGLR